MDATSLPWFVRDSDAMAQLRKYSLSRQVRHSYSNAARTVGGIGSLLVLPRGLLLMAVSCGCRVAGCASIGTFLVVSRFFVTVSYGSRRSAADTRAEASTWFLGSLAIARERASLLGAMNQAVTSAKYGV
ncbi:hypothetical protein BaRGS_00007812 [Batillaria attramentaria]|uniref:Uncharacterized protein n=1 Tax=Batillaria attramentaria TaxID=370345 RepID=A0ABD0LNM0_9CAEN